MSSHREAPSISKDPVADSTDLYAFVSPDATDTVTIIANYIPLEGPDAGPNFYEFGDDVLYEIHVDNDGDGEADVSFQFRFTTQVVQPSGLSNNFLYNVGQITSLTSPNWVRRQHYSVTRVRESGDTDVLATNLACPPCNVGPRSIPNYASLADAAVHSLGGGIKVFAGQRREGFFVDLGSVFDLADLRPFQGLHLIPSANQLGVDATKNLNVHSIAIQVPRAMLGRSGNRDAIIGVYTSASRRRALIRDDDADTDASGPWVQVSRLGNPLFNEVLVDMTRKDYWNSQPPSADSQFAGGVEHPELQTLLPILYPGLVAGKPAFHNLSLYTKKRADLVAIFLTGLPHLAINNPVTFTGATQADLLRLNMGFPAATSPNNLGYLGGDFAGFPNGRRVFDDVFAIELRAVAGATIPLVDPSFTADPAAGLVTDLVNSLGDSSPYKPGADRYISGFPYLGLPVSGYAEPTN
jgi:Domain of unknown function (DUF4331)